MNDHDQDDDHDHDHDHGGGVEAAERPMDLSRYDGVVGHVVRETSRCGREVLAVVQPDSVEKVVDRKASELARRVTLRGFRPGKAPVARVKSLHAAELRREAVEAVVLERLEEALHEAKLRPVGTPRITELSAEEGQPLRFAASFEVLPRVELTDLETIKVSDKTVKVTDAQVDEEVEAIRSARAELVPVEKEDVTPGDFAVVDLERFAPGAPLDQPPADERKGVIVEVGAAGNMPELERTVLGMGVGDVRTFQVTHPAEHPDSALAGQEVTMRVSLHGVRRRRLPELDEKLLKELGDFADVEALRTEVRRRLLERAKARARHEQDEEAIEQLLARHELEMPGTLVEQEAEARLRRGVERLVSQGVDVEKANIDWRGELGRAREAADRDLRTDYLLELVAQSRGVEVPPAEVDREIEILARARGARPTAVRADLEKSKRINELTGMLRRRRALDLLRSNATIREE
jgi:trigger factor